MNMELGDTRLLIRTAKGKGVLRNQLAYILATSYHETAHTMKPIKERGSQKYLKAKKYYPHIGMGYVQLTWEDNYNRASRELCELASEKMCVDFVNNPHLLLEPQYAAPILIIGMLEGWFTGKKLSDYITLQKSDFKNARRIVNGKDKADLIAEYARQYDKQLLQEGYGVEEKITISVDDVIPKPVEEKSVSKSSRLWSWLTTGGSAAVIPFADWKVQMVIVLALIGLACYAIFTMPKVKAKIERVIDLI